MTHWLNWLLDCVHQGSPSITILAAWRGTALTWLQWVRFIECQRNEYDLFVLCQGFICAASHSLLFYSPGGLLAQVRLLVIKIRTRAMTMVQTMLAQSADRFMVVLDPSLWSTNISTIQTLLL
jgi:hypothetical protein